MKTLYRLLAAATILAVVAAPSAFAQRQLGKKKGPTSKLFLAESVGEGNITTEGKSHTAKQATAFDAPGTVIETGKDSHQAFVYSNGTGMLVDENTRVEVDRFVQEPFRPDREKSTETEPSISQSDVFVSRGQVNICTSQLVSGSTMNYSTPNASVNIRGGKVAVSTNGSESTIYLLDGDITVRTGGKDTGGTLLRPGEKATIRPGPPGRPPIVTVAPIEPQMMPTLDDKVSAACAAKKTVSFETIETKAQFGAEGEPQQNTTGSGDTPAASNTPGNTGSTGTTDTPTEEIVATPTTPANLPTNITVSPDRLPGGQ
ncbi:FecR domain-containing protein [Oleiharenicola sp. Vm1]|uniref:FecR domain-containing protein n=1 Tax=Oleiharenicola sp. Vm1 TaxID=3398393 RepID=UPI0039F4B668